MPSLETIDVIVNDQHLKIAPGSSIIDLLNVLEIHSKAIAVEINQQLIPGDQHAATTLRPDDRLEVVTLVGGG